MLQETALGILLDGHSALLTGPPGAGKTYVLNTFIEAAQAMGKKVAKTATTGLAATYLNGSTIHAWAGIGIKSEISESDIDNITKTKREAIRSTDILIIDEISMLHDYRLDMVDFVCRIVRNSDKPFGGIQIVMSGDFFQLPPINRPGSREGSFVVSAESWRELDPEVLYLETQYRQEDEDLLEILSAMRDGDLRRSHAEKLLERVTDGERPENTELHTVNIDVDTINARKLNQLTGELERYEAYTSGAQNYVENLQRSMLAPAVLELKIGAHVMAVKNSPTRQYMNGSSGTVVGFETGTRYPIVEFSNGRTATMVPESWEYNDGVKKRASVSQIPLRLAWAITVHKSQGMTLDAANIDLRKAFVPGMGYVALSRVKSLDAISLYGINRTALQISGDALMIDEMLKNRTSQTKREYGHLVYSTEQKEENIAKQKAAKADSWAEKVKKMRVDYPNAYMRWTKKDDSTLVEMFNRGETIKAMSESLGRHEGSIEIRLKKLLGADVVG